MEHMKAGVIENRATAGWARRNQNGISSEAGLLSGFL